jgi:hypothetical protein
MKFFRRLGSVDQLFTNVGNAYVSALFRPVAGMVVVVRGLLLTCLDGKEV